MRKIHFVHLIRKRLYQDRDVHILESNRGTVLVSKVGKREDDAIILALVFLQKRGKQLSFRDGLDSAVPRQRFVHQNVVIAVLLECLAHGRSRFTDQLPGKKAAISEIQSKRCFPHKSLLLTQTRVISFHSNSIIIFGENKI